MTDSHPINKLNTQKVPFLVANETTGNADQTGLSSRILAILNELDSKLSSLISTGQEASIDLHRSPLDQGEHDSLKRWLGHGEVDAELELFGTTHVYESAISGIWWITHRNREGKIVYELIEITTCPELFKTDTAELKAGQRLLHNRLSSVSDDQTKNDDLIERLQTLGCFTNPRIKDNPS